MWDHDAETMNLTDAILFADGARGVYIPQHFAESINRECLTGVSEEDLATILEGPDADWYWEAWETILNNAIVTDADGVAYMLWQDGDLWLVPVGS